MKIASKWFLATLLFLIPIAAAGEEPPPFVGKWGRQGSAPGEFNIPIGLAVDGAGRVFVTDTYNDRVVTFTTNGEFLGQWPAPNLPLGIAIAPDGSVVTTHYLGMFVRKYQVDGTLVFSTGGYGDTPGLLLGARDVAVAPDGNIIVTDDVGSRINTFLPSGLFDSFWGYPISAWPFPYSIAVGPDGNLYLSDYNSFEIKKYTMQGVLLAAWGGLGSGDGQFSGPSALTVDAARNIYVADSENHRIQKFTNDGVLLTKWGTEGSGDGQFIRPTDVAVDAAGSVYVVDSGNQRIQKFSTITNTNLAPECDGATATTPELWSPNHEFAPVEIVGVTDPDGDPVTITVTGVTQDEPVDGIADGHTCPDAVIENGVASVRAERSSAAENGRVYAISFLASDGRGGNCEGTVHVCVPHDQSSGEVCVNDGQSFNSLEPCPALDRTWIATESASLRGDQASLRENPTRILRVDANHVVVEFHLAKDAEVVATLHDLAGRQIRTLERSGRPSGTQQASWDIAGLPRGVYFLRIQAAGRTITTARLILK